MLREQRIVHFDWRVRSGQWQEEIWLEIYSEDILWKAWFQARTFTLNVIGEEFVGMKPSVAV